MERNQLEEITMLLKAIGKEDIAMALENSNPVFSNYLAGMLLGMWDLIVEDPDVLTLDKKGMFSVDLDKAPEGVAFTYQFKDYKPAGKTDKDGHDGVSDETYDDGPTEAERKRSKAETHAPQPPHDNRSEWTEDHANRTGGARAGVIRANENIDERPEAEDSMEAQGKETEAMKRKKKKQAQGGLDGLLPENLMP